MFSTFITRLYVTRFCIKILQRDTPVIFGYTRNARPGVFLRQLIGRQSGKCVRTLTHALTSDNILRRSCARHYHGDTVNLFSVSATPRNKHVSHSRAPKLQRFLEILVVDGFFDFQRGVHAFYQRQLDDFVLLQAHDFRFGFIGRLQQR